MSERSPTEGPLRLFAAIEVAASSKLVDLHTALAEFAPPVRTTRLDQLHVTLKFFGATDQVTAALLCDGTDRIAVDTNAFSWRVHDVGAFPSRSQPSFMWAGAREEDSLRRVAERRSSLGEEHGFARERRPFQPHVTMARIRDRPPRDLKRVFDAFAGEDFGVQQTMRITIYCSVLRKSGPVYHPMHFAPLRQALSETAC